MFKKMFIFVSTGVLLWSMIGVSTHAAYFRQTNTYHQASSWYNDYTSDRTYSSWRTSSRSTNQSTSTTNPKIEEVIDLGYTYLGTPYLFGSSRSTTTTFDCSDFVKHVFNEAADIVLPSNSRTQGSYVQEHTEITTNWENLERGDLMFFMSYQGSKKSDYADKQPLKERISHVGIYLGDGKILHTYSEKSGGVRVDSFENTHFEYRFLFGGSVIE